MEKVDEILEKRIEKISFECKKQRRQADIKDYVYDKRQEKFWDLLDGGLHTEKSVDASIPIEKWRVIIEEKEDQAEKKGRPKKRKEILVKPSFDILRVENDQFVEGSTWWPGKEKIIQDWFVDKNGAEESIGRRLFNEYKPMPKMNGDAESAWPWIDHIKKLWPDPIEHDYFFDYFAHTKQKPHEKINVAIVLCGKQGIGKDAALQPIRDMIGSWNCKEIGPDMLLSQFTPFVQTLMLVVNEAKPVQIEHQAIAIYNTLKTLSASPPNVLPLNDKKDKVIYCLNLMRVVITTNNANDLYIPEDDRRLFIMQSPLQKQWAVKENRPQYFVNIFNWIEKGGSAHVAAWLQNRDISKFNPKAEALLTQAKESICGTWEAPEDVINAALERIGNPDIFFGFELLEGEFDGKEEINKLMQAKRRLEMRMLRSGYTTKKREDGGEKWSFSHEGRILKSRVAFVKEELIREENLCEMIFERGNRIVAKKPVVNIFSFKKTST